MTYALRKYGANPSPSYYRYEHSGMDGKYNSDKSLRWNDYFMSVDSATMVRGQGSPYPGWGFPGSWIPTDFSDNPAWSNNDELRLLNKLADATREHKFNLGVVTAESKKTFNMVLGNIVRITKSLSALKRGQFGQAARYLGVSPPPSQQRRKRPGSPRSLVSKDISSQWLELQYGWLPLLGDVYEGMTAFAVLHNKARTARFRVSSGYDQVESVRGAVDAWGVAGFSGSRNFRQSKYLVCVLTEQLEGSRSLGLQNPTSVAWEVVPFSFVADWFVPIGSYLDVLSVVPHLKGKFLITKVVRSDGKLTGSVRRGPYLTGTPPEEHPDRTYDQASTSYKHVRVDRSTSNSLSVPFPQFVGLESAFSVKRMANATALLHQIFT